ncbi:MAG: transposase [Kiritimatiellae bacterium]|nr:transposase [Kiritimatiellia bacterium]
MRGRKTDKQDAVAIAGIVARGEHAARRPEGEAERNLKCLTRQRGYLVSGRSGSKNRLRDQLLESFPEFPALFKDLFSRLPLALLDKWPGAAALARARKGSVAKVVKANSRGKDAGKEAARIIAAAKDSICFAHPPPKSAALCIRSTLRALRDLDASIEEIDAEIQECERPEMARLMEGIKGAGKTMPMVIASEFGGFERFEVSPTTGKGADMAKRMLAFAGCEPRIRESGKWKGKTKVSKRGSGQLRLALYLAANTIRMNDGYFRAVYDEKAKTKHHSVALFYVIRKLLEVLCSLHRTGREYSPTYAGRSCGQPVAIG